MGIHLFAEVGLTSNTDTHANFQGFDKGFLFLLRAATAESWDYYIVDLASRTDGCVDDSSFDVNVRGFSNTEDCIPLNGYGNSIVYVLLCSFKLIVANVMLNLTVAVVLESFATSQEEQRFSTSGSNFRFRVPYIKCIYLQLQLEFIFEARPPAMKKLLGVFARAQASESPRSAPTGGADVQTKRWGGFLLPLAAPQPVVPANHEVLREVDAVVRGIAARVKAALAKMLDGEEFEHELRDFNDFVEQALAKLPQHTSEPMPELLKGYFSSSVGIAGCEQTAFPSLVLDFVAKMRAYAMKEELSIKMQRREGSRSGEGNEDASATAWTEGRSECEAPVSFDSFVPPLEFVMDCVIAIASSETLMDKFRCELPNIIALAAEEYPPVAMFIRDHCNRALLSVPDRSFNAGLAWYLLDCNVITKTVELMTSYALATTTTPDNAERALQTYLSSTPDRCIQGSSEAGIDDSAAEAAVSEALGLTRCDREASPTSSPSLPSEEDLRGGPQSSSETFCLPNYDVRVGLRAVVYVLEKTYRFTLVLLEEFHTSGGYALLLRLLDTCTEEEIPTLLDILTLLIPLGSRSSESSESAERMASGSTFGARNANAFAAMRDLLLNCITGAIEDAEAATELNAETQRRNEHLILQLLTHVLHIYTSDYDNFVFLEPKTRTLALLLTKLPYTSFYDAQVIILRVVEYVCCAAKPDDSLPHEILSIVCGLLIAYSPLSFQATSSDADPNLEESSTILSPQTLLNAFKEGPRATLSALMCECLVKILQNCEAERYKQELSGFGLMDRGIYVWLEQLARCLIAVPESDLPTRHELLTALMPHIDMYDTLVRLMLHHNVQECVRFRQARAAQSIYSITEVLVSSDVLATPFDLAHEDHSAMNAFSIMTTFIDLADILRFSSSRERDDQASSSAEVLQVGLEADLSAILELMQRFRGAVWRQILLLNVLKDMLKAGGLTIAPLWKACQGYEILVALLSSVDLDGGDSPERAFKMMDLVLELLSVTLDLQFDSQHGDNVYTEYFRSIHGYSTVASCIHTSGVMQSAKREMVLQRVFDIICGGAQKHGILNGDAAQIVFRLLPILPASDAIDAMEKLLLMVESNGAARFSRKEQAVRLVRAGAFQWIDEPELIAMIRNPEDPLNPVLVKWIVTIALEDDLAISSLQSFLGIVGKAMPMLLCKQQAEEDSSLETPEPGLLMLQTMLRNPAIRHIAVGKPQGDDQTGRYVHVVNSADRVWPPSSGYSFSCWLKFPTLMATDSLNADKAKPLGINTRQELVPLCQGFLSLTCGNEEKMDVYGVLAGTTLTLYPSSESAAQKEDAIEELDVRNAYREGPLEWSFHSDARSFVASCIDVDTVDTWWRAVQQCSKSKTGQPGGLLDEGSLPFLGARGDNDTGPRENVLPDSEEGSACIVSIYSLESSGCFVRAFFEQSTGFLHFHTGTVNAGSSINPNPKRTSVVFEAVAIDELRPTGSPSGFEQKRDWHHFAFTHRKAVVGSSAITVYIDGLEVAAKKLNYPSASSVGSFQAFVGSDAQVCSPQSALSWNVGSTWLTDEILSSSTIASIFSLGPAYSHQLSGHSYRSVGDWSEALASLHLTRAADRGLEIAKFAQRLQLSKLGRSCQRQWFISSTMEKVSQNLPNDTINTSAALLAESMMAKKDELTEGLRLAAGGETPSSRKERNKVAAFRSFISYDCAMNSFGSEMETLLGACKVAEDAVLFTLNTSCGDRSSTSHTQVHYINCAPSNRLDLARSLPSIGGIGQALFPLLDNATRQCDFYLILNMLVNVLRRNASCLAECIGSNGYSFLAALICARVHLVNENVLTCVVRLAVAGKMVPYATFHAGATTQTLLAHPVVVDALALSQVVLNVQMRGKLPDHLQCQLVSLLMDLLVPSNPNALFNARQLRRAGLLQWLLTYLTDLGNEECTMDQATALEMRWCFPKFRELTFEAILQYALSLLRVFLRIESHVDDFNAIAELLLLSMATTAMHTRDSPVRVIVLQYLLHEVEHDASNNETNEVADRTAKPHRLSDTIVETILYREVAVPAKKRSEKRVDNGNLETASLGSPLADSSSNFGKSFFSGYPVDGFANVLLEIIDQPRENGRWISVEALLAVRILVSLAQSHMAFGEYLLCQPVLMEKLKRVLLKYSTDCCVYIPLLAYVSSILIEDTSYYDTDTLSTSKMGSQALFPPAAQAKKERCVDLVWVLIGGLLLQNCRLTSSKIAREVNGIVLGKLACEVETSIPFLTSVCKSSGTLFRILVECLLSGRDAPSRQDTPMTESSMESTPTNVLNDILEQLTKRMGSDASDSNSVGDSCVKLTQTIMLRALSGGNEFGSLMILFLEALDEAILKREESALACLGGQKCWLALLKFVIEKGKVMTTSTSLISMKNLCTVCAAICRYLADEENHHLAQAATSELDFDASVARTLTPDVESSGVRGVVCFGVEVLTFLLRCCAECSQPSVAQQLGVEEQRFLYGTLVYCTQTVMLSELDEAHRSMVSSQRILNCLLEAKDMLLQQPSWQSVMMSGLLAQSSTNDIAGTIESNKIAARPSRRMHRVRSLSANVHKEFGIGAESDRSFILCLASHLYRMLLNDSSEVRHTAIVMWQFLIDQRFEVLKELLIAEPRSSLLQTITSTKKEAAVDIFHGGFDRLLYALHRADTEDDQSTMDTSLNREIWCQFQLWLAENNALLTDLIITRTETIHRHMLDVLKSCICIRSSSDANELSLNTDFPARLDVRSTSASGEIYGGFESDRCDLIVKKAIMKYTSRRDSALESMNDGLAQWRETSLRLANTRNIWQTGRWQIDAPCGDDQRLASEEEPQRSVFQHKSLGYRLDSTEGPQRMRLRLVRDYSWGDKEKQTIQAPPTGDSTDQPTEIDDTSVETESILCPGRLPYTKKAEHLENEPFRRSLEFHEVVEVFREFVYQQTVSVAPGESNVNVLHSILSRCKMDSPYKTFGWLADVSTGDSGELTPLSLARAIVNSISESIENGEKPGMGVSPSVLGDISSLIRDAAESPDEHPLLSTLFDAADAEATQYALCLVRHESLRSIRLEVPIVQENAGAVDRDGSDDELEEETPVADTLLVDDAESEDSDGPEEIKTTAVNEEETTLEEAQLGTDERDAIESVSIDEPLSPKPVQVKQFDTSSDAVYGAIARFLRRDDYPPMKSYNAAFIAGMGKTPGLFVICRFGLYFIGGYTKLFGDSGEGNVLNNPSTEVQFVDDVNPNQPRSQSAKTMNTPTRGRRKATKTLLRAALTDLGVPLSQPKAGGEQFFTVVPLLDLAMDPGEQPTAATSSRWSIKYSNVKQFCRIKYQLRPVGIEFFDTFGSTYFLQLETSTEREEIVKLLFQMPLVNSIFWSPILRTGALVPSVKRIRHAATKRWLRGSMTNFEYLIHLNTLAGRSLNDITQYPVFPWVIADYTSEFLDLDARDTYRDLSRPMGAIGETRAAQFCERYAAMSQDVDVEDPMGTPAFHYGTHYSCSAYVINYLIRLEPFTALALELQGGAFDHPDRLFRSVPSSWTSASKDNLQDVRELIPEFYYLPEFLYNANNCAFGTTQSGEEVCHVLLPPWAHGDPREFVRLNRRALESKYVSEHLHEWIDLVFGSKQTGQAAVDAQNVFMHFTYEGTVDIEQISDPVMRAATLAQIENFGQTPSRLFSSPHPQRKVPSLVPCSLNGSAVSDTTTQALNPSVGHQYDGMTLSTIEAYVKWHTPLAPALVAIGKDYVFLKKHSVVSVQVTGVAIGDVKLVHDKMQCQGIGCTFMPPRFAKYLDWGNSSGLMKLRVHQPSSGTGRYRETSKVLAIIEGAHHSEINCAAVSEDGSLLVTGGQDSVVNLIECSKAPDGRRVFKQMAKFVGHSHAVICVAINKELNLIASSSVDRSVLLWDLRTRALLQELAGHSTTVIHSSINSANGNVLTATSSEIRLWSVNGDLLASCSSSAFGLQAITCALSTSCESWQSGVVAVTGHMNGAIALWGLRYPAELAQQKKDNVDAEVASAKLSRMQNPSVAGAFCSSPSSSRRLELANMPVSIQRHGTLSGSRLPVVPSCQLFILKLLLDHRTKITALTLGPEQRQLLSGDAEGNCIRWVDDSISTNIH